jgi:hypothetical protein
MSGGGQAHATLRQMHEIRTATEIAARPERVWEVLSDLPGHSEWNPFVRSIEGRLAAGERLRIWVQPPGGRGMRFQPEVLEAVPNRRLRWLGRLLFPGIFDGEHYFEIEELGPNRVRFIHGEKFSGILVPLMRRSLDQGTRAGFEAMNAALRARAESA